MNSDNEKECKDKDTTYNKRKDTVDNERKDEDVKCCMKKKYQKYLVDAFKFFGLLAIVFGTFYVLYLLKEYQTSYKLKHAPKKIWTKQDLDKIELPSWYDKAKIGISITWGIFSVVGYGPDSELLWLKSYTNEECQDFLLGAYGSRFQYTDLTHEFTAEHFDPAYWAWLFANSGAKYLLVTCKYEDGYSLFRPDQNMGWDTGSSGPYRDILQELLKEVNRYDMKFGIGYSAYEWFNPELRLQQEQQGKPRFDRYTSDKFLPDIIKLINNYAPSLIYVSNTGDFSFIFDNFLLWLYEHSLLKDNVVTLTNDAYEFRHATGKKDFPQPWKRDETVIENIIKLEKLIKLDRDSLGFRHNLELSDVMTTKEMLLAVISSIAKGRNVLLNIGPNKDGIIPLIYQKRLLELGRWLRANGEAVYETVPWKRAQDDLNGAAFYTCIVTGGVHFDVKNVSLEEYELLKLNNPVVMSTLYVIFFKWPYNGILRLRYIAHLFVNDTYQVEFLEQPSRYWNWTIYQNGMYSEIEIQLPKRTTVTSKHAWVLRISAKPTDEYQGKNVSASARETKNVTKDLRKKDQSVNIQRHHKYYRENVTSAIIQASNQILPNVKSPVVHSYNQTLPIVTSPFIHSSDQTLLNVTSPVVQSSTQTFPNVTSPVVQSSNQTLSNVTLPFIHSSNQTLPNVTSPVIQSSNKTLPNVKPPVIHSYNQTLLNVTSPVIY